MYVKAFKKAKIKISFAINIGIDKVGKLYLISFLQIFNSLKTKMIEIIILISIVNNCKSPPPKISGTNAELILLNESGNGAIVLPCKTTNVSPLKINIPAKVTINEGMFTYATQNPCQAPIIAPNIKHNIMPTNTGKS